VVHDRERCVGSASVRARTRQELFQAESRGLALNCPHRHGGVAVGEEKAQGTRHRRSVATFGEISR
jgi:hypothetical protein